MAYSTYSDVASLIKWTTFTTTSKVTTTEIGTIISEIDAMIDSALSKRYVVPITDSEDLKIMKYISSRLSAVEVAHILVLQASGEIPEVVNYWKEQAMLRLESIVNGDLELTGSTVTDSTSGWANDTVSADPIWKLREDQW